MKTYLYLISIVVLLFSLPFQNNDNMFLLVGIPVLIIFLSYKLFKNLTTDSFDSESLLIKKEKVIKIMKWIPVLCLPGFLFAGKLLYEPGDGFSAFYGAFAFIIAVFIFLLLEAVFFFTFDLYK